MAMETCRSLCARERALEARHFGYATLRELVRGRWRTMSESERMEMAALAHGMLREVSEGGGGEAYAVKSKAATLMAEVVRQEGASLWTRLVPDLMAMAASEEPQAAEMGANVIRFVAEDVAVYNEDLIGGRMRELLGGLSSTVGTVLPAIYSLMERHYTKAKSVADVNLVKQHAAAVSAALGAASVYSEWAPLAPIMRSGLIEACGMLLVRLSFSRFFLLRARHGITLRSLSTSMMIIQQGSTIRTSLCGTFASTVRDAAAERRDSCFFSTARRDDRRLTRRRVSFYPSRSRARISDVPRATSFDPSCLEEVTSPRASTNRTTRISKKEWCSRRTRCPRRRNTSSRIRNSPTSLAIQRS